MYLRVPECYYKWKHSWDVREWARSRLRHAGSRQDTPRGRKNRCPVSGHRKVHRCLHIDIAVSPFIRQPEQANNCGIANRCVASPPINPELIGTAEFQRRAFPREESGHTIRDRKALQACKSFLDFGPELKRQKIKYAAYYVAGHTVAMIAGSQLAL